MKKKVLFILGTAHCGSTLLALILDSHPDCFTVGEISNFPQLHKSGKSICSICKGTCNFWDEKFSKQELNKLSLGFSNTRLNPLIPLKVERLLREAVKDTVFHPYSTIAAKTSAQVIVDSTKVAQWIDAESQLPEFKQDLDAYLIHLVRDGRAIMHSYFKRERNASMTVKDFSNMWLKRIAQNEALYEKFPADRRLKVAYEDLATHPEETVKQVCNFLNIPFKPDILKFWAFEHHIISGNSGTRSMIDKYHNQAEANQDSGELAIRLDQQWKKKLKPESLEEFYTLIGDRNKPYESKIP